MRRSAFRPMFPSRRRFRWSDLVRRRGLLSSLDDDDRSARRAAFNKFQQAGDLSPAFFALSACRETGFLEPIECVDPTGELIALVIGKLARRATACDGYDVVTGISEFAEAEGNRCRRLLAGRQHGEDRKALRWLVWGHAQRAGQRSA